MFWSTAAMDIKKRIYFKSTPNRKVLAIGLVYFDINLKKQMRRP